MVSPKFLSRRRFGAVVLHGHDVNAELRARDAVAHTIAGGGLHRGCTYHRYRPGEFQLDVSIGTSISCSPTTLEQNRLPLALSLSVPYNAERRVRYAHRGEAMISEYIQAALERARYEIIDDQEPYYGEVRELAGVWASGGTLEECRRQLVDVIEGWIVVRLRNGMAIPPLGDSTISEPKSIEVGT